MRALLKNLETVQGFTAYLATGLKPGDGTKSPVILDDIVLHFQVESALARKG